MKLVGDAGEHYALSQFSFEGKSAAKMPDTWKAYDLVVETGSGLARVSVKTRTESKGWRSSKWFMFDDRLQCDWMVFVFKPASGGPRAWVIPYAVALEHANRPGKDRQEPHERKVSWKKLTGSLATFENNWTMDAEP